MAIQELKLDLDVKHRGTHILGRQDVLSKTIEGLWATAFKGRGIEFTGYRAYTFSDDASFIDWKASLRSKTLLIREFEEYKNYNVFFLLDVSNTMLFSSNEKFKAEYGAELVFSLSQAAYSGGDAIGLAMFSDRLVAQIPPGFGMGMKSRFKHVLSQKEFYGGPKNFKKAVLQLESVLPDRCVIIIVSDFLGLGENWEKYLTILAKRNQVIGLMLRDERDRDLPKGGGQFVVMDPNTTETMYIDANDFRKRYIAMNRQNENYIRGIFRKLRSGCLLVLNGETDAKKFKHFFAGLVR